MRNPYQGILSPRKKQRKKPTKEQLIVTSKEDLYELADLIDYPVILNLEFE